MGRTAAVWNLIIRDGEKVKEDFVFYQSTGVPYDFTDWDARMEIRASSGSPVLLEFSTANGKITLDANGRVHIESSQADVTDLDWTAAIYTLKLIPPSGEEDAYTQLYGAVRVMEPVTS